MVSAVNFQANPCATDFFPPQKGLAAFVFTAHQPGSIPVP